MSEPQVPVPPAGKLYNQPLQSAYTRASPPGNIEVLRAEACGRKVKECCLGVSLNKCSPPSIPSRHEQVLLRPHLSKEGFGQQSERFHSEVSRNPGPGLYSEQRQSPSPSYSQKGFLSGFVSTSKRFTVKQFQNSVPGPGAYSPIDRKGGGNPASGLASKGFFVIRRGEMRPGPGEYNAEGPKSTATVTNPFRSKAKRGDYFPKTDVPAPWTYHPNDKITRSSSQEVTSAFRAPLNLRRKKVNLYDPHEEIREEPSPGPGHYEKTRAFDGVTPSVNSSFIRQGKEKLSLFEPGKSLIPGPGAYVELTDRTKKLAVSGSAFMSETRREENSPQKVPGPAFYQPKLRTNEGNHESYREIGWKLERLMPKKKSFLLNSDRKWV